MDGSDDSELNETLSGKSDRYNYNFIQGEFIEPLDKIQKNSLRMCFLFSIISDTSGFYGSYSMI